MTTLLSSIGQRIRKLSLSQKDVPPSNTVRMPTVPEFDVARLPAEIRLSLLKSADNLFTLRCLATSSAAFLLVYNDNRQVVLDAVMGRPIDLSLVPESAFASATSRIDFEAADVAAQIARYLRKYHERKESPTSGRITGLFNKEQQAQNMKGLFSIVDALCSDFCTRASRDIGLADGSIDYKSLSTSEVHRLHRAFFRYELFSNLYRDQGLCLDYDRQQYAPGLTSFNKNFVYRDDYDETAVDDENMAQDFLLPFAPWEVEEFACVYDYLTQRWSEVMARMQPYFVSTNPNPDIDATDPSIDLSPDSFSYNGYRRHFCMLGLEFLHGFVAPGADIEEHQKTIRQNLHYGTCDPQSVIAAYQYQMSDRKASPPEQSPPSTPQTLNRARHPSMPNPGWRPSQTELAEAAFPEGSDNVMRASGCIFWDATRINFLASTLQSIRAEEVAAAAASQEAINEAATAS